MRVNIEVKGEKKMVSKSRMKLYLLLYIFGIFSFFGSLLLFGRCGREEWFLLSGLSCLCPIPYKKAKQKEYYENHSHETPTWHDIKSINIWYFFGLVFVVIYVMIKFF